VKRRLQVALGLVCSLSVLESAGFAAGLSRPNVNGARAVGLGGAFTAVADDPTAMWYNPGAPAFFGDNVVYLGGELLLTEREYTPSADSPLGKDGHTQPIKENSDPTFIPMFGASSRFGFGKTKPTRFALSILGHVGYGGAIRFARSDLNKPATMNPSGLAYTQILDYEITPGLSYQVNEVLSIGFGLRIGVTSFSVQDFESAFSATLATTGVGIGASLGAMIRPHRMVDIGLVYRTPLSATATGSGPVTISGQTAQNRDASMSITWPQSAGVGIAVKPHWRVLATVQGDWTAWSSVQKLSIELAGLGAPTIRQMKFSDSYALHIGAQVIITRFLLLRVGYAIDTNAIPDATTRRENQDGLKATLAGGIGVHLWKFFFDAAVEGFIPLDAARVIAVQGPDNEAGKYRAQVISVELSGQIRF
jgi:long-chain fatty acid transport protein